MSDPRTPPRDLKPSTTNLDVLTTIGGVTVWAPAAVPVIRDPLVTVVDGNPGLIFDNDGKILTVEGP